MSFESYHIVTVWKADTYLKVILLKSVSLLLTWCQDICGGPSMGFGGWGGHEIPANACKMWCVQMALGSFVCFLITGKNFLLSSDFRRLFKTGKKASWEVAQICGSRLSTWQCNLGQVTYTPSSSVSSSMKWQ